MSPPMTTPDEAVKLEAVHASPDRQTLDEIAGRLTEAQRNAVLCGLSGYFDPNTIKALRRKGLYSGGLLSESGLALRDHLKGEGR